MLVTDKEFESMIFSGKWLSVKSLSKEEFILELKKQIGVKFSLFNQSNLNVRPSTVSSIQDMINDLETLQDALLGNEETEYSKRLYVETDEVSQTLESFILPKD